MRLRPFSVGHVPGPHSISLCVLLLWTTSTGWRKPQVGSCQTSWCPAGRQEEREREHSRSHFFSLWSNSGDSGAAPPRRCRCRRCYTRHRAFQKRTTRMTMVAYIYIYMKQRKKPPNKTRWRASSCLAVANRRKCFDQEGRLRWTKENYIVIGFPYIYTHTLEISAHLNTKAEHR